MQKKFIQPGQKLALKLTAAERRLVIDEVMWLDGIYEQIIQDTPADEPIMMTLDDLDDFSGFIAAEANHCDGSKKQKKLDAVFEKALKLLDRYTEEEPAPQSLSIAEAQNKLSQAMNSLMAGQDPGPVSFQLRPEELTQSGLIKLTPLQRETLIEHTDLKPAIKRKLKKAGDGTQTIEFNRDELNEIHDSTGSAATYARSKEKQRLMAVQAKIVRIFEKDRAALFEPSKPKPIRRKASRSDVLIQFRITLHDIKPTIWRRIQVRDCSLGELHRHIQAAMGWQDCHLHQFLIDGKFYGPTSVDDFGVDMNDEDEVVLSEFLPKSGERIRWMYEYDFGDGWRHDLLFEGYPPIDKKTKYPLCLEGARACPPEDVGGFMGYVEYLEAVADPSHEQHKELIEWQGPFDPEGFDADETTRKMRQSIR